MKKTEEKVKAFISEKGLMKEGARVVVGLSGGPDSVCLLKILHSLGYGIVAVHCNFHLRGEESDRDEAFARKLCEETGVECVKVDFDTETWAKEHGVSIEMAARELRYSFFRKLMVEKGCDAIAVGHHQGDNIETLLLNIVRGTGIQGACAIQPKNGNIVRPLLCVTREEIIEYLNDMEQGYVTDHTNLEDEYSRNKIRLNVVPQLESINQAAKSNIATTIENLNEVRLVYQMAMKKAIEECCTTESDGSVRISIKKLRNQTSPISVLHEVLSPIGFNREQMKGMLKSMNDSGRVFCNSEGRRVLVDRDDLIVEGERRADSNALLDANGAKGNIHIQDIAEMKVIDRKELIINKDSRYAYLDADKVRGELTVRLPKEGDSFAPFGMKGKRKLLSDFMTDLKMNRFEKEKQPLLCDGDEIAWVVGRRSSELYRVDKNTKKVIMLFRVS